MHLLLHVCCGPCTIYPLKRLREEGLEVTAFFHNPNIHPYKEFRRRLGAMQELAEQEQLDLLVDSNYGLTDYLRQVVFHERERCAICYDMRFSAVARQAEKGGFDGFSSTLLYSRYQNHALIRAKGEQYAQERELDFYYEDFRQGWQEGIDGAIARGLYRQPYCGCIYSEQERYDRKLRKKLRAGQGNG
jgi:predicted adenine nucleotide alpha hydrolase (AANH) superfamily ATPase